LCAIAVIMTAGVYGLVAAIVKLDDLGLHLSKKTGAQRLLGAGILKAAPYLMKGLSIAGTVAMFLVGGGILTHGLPPVHHWIEGVAEQAGSGAGIGGVLRAALPSLLDGLAGVLVGIVAVALFALVKRIARPRARRP
jgi:hypothetical protein